MKAMVEKWMKHMIVFHHAHSQQKKTQNKWEREGNVHACENDSSCTTTRSALKSMCGIALWDCVIGILFYNSIIFI